MALLTSARESFDQLIQSMSAEQIILVLDPNVVFLLNAIISKDLKKNYPQITQIFYLENPFEPQPSQSVLIMARSDKKNLVQRQINKYPNYKYYVRIVPDMGLSLSRYFESVGIDPTIVRPEPSISLMPIPSDPFVLTMNLPSNTHYELTRFETLLDSIMYGIAYHSSRARLVMTGPNCRQILNQFAKWSDPRSLPSTFSTVLIIDRQCDLTSPLLSQRTYGGLLLQTELYANLHKDMAIEEAKMCRKALNKELSPEEIKEITQRQMTQSKTTYVSTLDRKDLLYEKLAFENFENVSDKIRQIAQEVQNVRESIKSNAINMTDLKEKADFLFQNSHNMYDSHIAQIQSLVNKYKNNLNEYINQGESPTLMTGFPDDYVNKLVESKDIRSLLTLYCLSVQFCHGAFGTFEEEFEKIFTDNFKRHMLTVHNLREYGVLTTEPPGNPTARKIINESDHKLPILAQKLLSNNSYKKIKHNPFGIFYQNPLIDETIDKQTLIFVNGGLTYDELREFRQKFPNTYIGTTHFISPTQFIDGFVIEHLIK